MKSYYLTILAFFGLNLSLIAQNGIIKGKVVDASNNEPIMFATVAIVGTDKGVTTDLDGNYIFEGLEPALYNLEVSYLGYKPASANEIQATNSRPTVVDFEMTEETETGPEIVVRASPFKKTEESPVSLRTIGTAEIQRNPGGNRDISRVIRVLPGVTTTASFRNDLLIRGGAPNENRFFLDDVEVPTINHFSTQGASGGPNGLINVDFINEVDFYSGAFPVNRMNTLSSVFNFKQKNGRDDRIGFTATLGTSDLALTLEGPLSKNKNTTFLFSARQSYLQFLFRLIELPFLPTYNDFQFKVRTKFDEKNEFYVVGLGAIDRFKLNLDANETPEQRFLLDNLPVNNQWNYTVGGVYKHYTDKSYWLFVVSRSMLNNDIYKHFDNDETQERFIDYTSQESENKLRIENTIRQNGFRINYGVNYEYARYTNRTKDFQLINGHATAVEFESTLLLHKYGAFGQLSKNLFKDKLILSAGVRLDGNSFSQAMANPLPQVSPRFSAAWAVTERLAINFNTGLYYQLPPYTTLGYRENGILANQDRLDYIRSFHVVGGVEYTTKSSTKFSVEGYWKQYSNYPYLLNEQITLANFGADFGVLGNAPIDSRAAGRAYGLELLVQQRLYKGFYGIMSYTLGWSEFEDRNGDFVASSWDSRHIVNVAAGKTFNTMNSDIRAKKNEKREAKGKDAIDKKLTAQTLDFGVNFRFQTGLPFTPFDEEASALTANWDVFGRGIRNFNLLNTGRANNFYAVDFRVDYKWFFPKWSFNLYLDIQNLPGIASGLPELILDQGEDGTEPVQVVNQGQSNESYQLRRITGGAGTSVPTLGIIVQY